MVSTIKISQMTDGGNLDLDKVVPGLDSGANRKFTVQLQFSETGDTASRPASPADPTIRYNTDFAQFEYWDGLVWQQLGGSSDVAVLIARLAAHTVGDGASMIGLLDQGSVLNKTVQDLANSSFIVKTGTSSLFAGFALSSLSTGYLSVETATGNLVSRTFTGAASQIDLTNPTGLAGNTQISFAANPLMTGTASLTIPLGTTAQRPGIPTNGMIRYNTDLNALEYYNANAVAWQQATAVGGAVTSVSGTANRITSTGGTTPVIDISASYVGQSSITTLGTIATGVWQGTVIGSTYGGTGVNNGASTLTLGGSLVTSGAFASTFTMTGVTNVTFPTSGTLLTAAGAVTSLAGTANQITASAAVGAVTLAIASNPILPGTGGFTLPTGTTAQRAGGAGTMRFNSQTNIFECTTDGATWATLDTSLTGVQSVSGTANRITSTGGITPVIDIAATYVGQSSITTLGTITTGVWNGTTIAIANGGTGITSFGTGVQTALGQNVTGSGGIVLGTSPTITTPVIARINDANGNEALVLASVASAINYLSITNSAIGVNPTLSSAGDDTNIGMILLTKGTGQFNLNSNNTTTPLLINSGTSLQHSTAFVFANTAASRTVTFPDASGTVAFTGSSGFTDINVQVFTSGSATYTPTSGTSQCDVYVTGSGAGGGGSAGGTSPQAGAGGGGGAGGTSILYGVAIATITGQTVTVATGGNGGTAGNNAGSNGSASSVGAVITANGGTGGSGMASSTSTNSGVIGGAGGTAGSGGSVNMTGGNGGSSTANGGSGGPTLRPGIGGTSFWGGSGNITTSAGTGANAPATAYGGGGAGGGSTTGNSAGGNGANGVVVIVEYIQ